MKEAIGGTWIFGIVITLVAFFTAFISFSLNYSRCYKVKNEMLSVIERNNGINQDSITEINKYINSIGYSGTGKCEPQSNAACLVGFKKNDNTKSFTSISTQEYNYCIEKMVMNKSGNSDLTGMPASAYYHIRVFFTLDMPIVGNFFNLKVEGETSTIYLPNDGVNFSNCSME